MTADDPQLFTDRSPFASDPAVEHCVALEIGLQTAESVLSQPNEVPGVWEEPPRWRSGLSYVDAAQGGFTGLTAIAGEEGLGKSMIALGSGLEAAIDGWGVFYLNAELTRDELEARWDALREVHGRLVEEARERFWWVQVAPGFTPEKFVTIFEQAVLEGTRGDPARWPPRVLIVPDSLNTIAKLAGGPYLRTLDRLSMWALQVRKISRGRVCWLVVGEMNQQGGIKGAQLSYWSDTYLLLKRNSEDPALVDIQVKKARQGPSQPPVPHRLDYPRRRFVVASAEDLERG